MMVRDCHTVRRVDPKTGKITFETEERWLDIPEAMTEEQGLVATAQQAQLDANSRTIEDQAATALAGLRAYRDLANPTNAQTVAAVKLLCRVAIGLIRLRLARFDAVD
jgi:hypothetical protein